MMISLTTGLLICSTALQIATIAYGVQRIRHDGAQAAWLALSSIALLLLLRGGFLALGGSLPGLQIGLATELISLVLSSKLLLSFVLLHREARRSAQVAAQHHAFLRDVLSSVTSGKLRLCDGITAVLPDHYKEEVGETPLPLTTEALRAMRRRIDEAASACCLTPERHAELLLSAGEAAMNAVVHSKSGLARVCYDSASQTVQVWVTDQGDGIALDRLPRATLERGFSSAGSLGQGFPLMVETADCVYLKTGPKGTTVVVEVSQDRNENDMAILNNFSAVTVRPVPKVSPAPQGNVIAMA